MRDYFEAIAYVHPTDMKQYLFCAATAMDDLENFILTKDSVFGSVWHDFLCHKFLSSGLFLRKFALAFHQLSFEELTKFMDSYFTTYDAHAKSVKTDGSTDLPSSDAKCTSFWKLQCNSTSKYAELYLMDIYVCVSEVVLMLQSSPPNW